MVTIEQLRAWDLALEEAHRRKDMDQVYVVWRSISRALENEYREEATRVAAKQA